MSGTMYPRRRSARLQDYDYSKAGAYAITICCHDKLPLFGQAVNGEMLVNDAGRIVEREWQRTPVIRPAIDLDVFVIMPNHLHGILVLTSDLPRAPTVRAAPTRLVSPSNTVGAIIRGFKGTTTRQIREAMQLNHPVWQRGYYEHVIRNDTALQHLREYIVTNPLQWSLDSLYRA